MDEIKKLVSPELLYSVKSCVGLSVPIPTLPVESTLTCSAPPANKTNSFPAAPICTIESDEVFESTKEILDKVSEDSKVATMFAPPLLT